MKTAHVENTYTLLSVDVKMESVFLLSGVAGFVRGKDQLTCVGTFRSQRGFRQQHPSPLTDRAWLWGGVSSCGITCVSGLPAASEEGARSHQEGCGTWMFRHESGPDRGHQWPGLLIQTGAQQKHFSGI